MSLPHACNIKTWLKYANEQRKYCNLPPLNKIQYYQHMIAWLVHNDLFKCEFEWVQCILSTEPTVLNYYLTSGTIERPYEPGQILLMIEPDKKHKKKDVSHYIRYNNLLDAISDDYYNSIIGIKRQMINMYFPFYLFFTVDNRITLNSNLWIKNKLQSIPSLKSYRYIIMNRTHLSHCIIQYKCKNYDNYVSKMKLLKIEPIPINSGVIMPYYDNKFDDNFNNIHLYVIACT